MRITRYLRGATLRSDRFDSVLLCVTVFLLPLLRRRILRIRIGERLLRIHTRPRSLPRQIRDIERLLQSEIEPRLRRNFYLLSMGENLNTCPGSTAYSCADCRSFASSRDRGRRQRSGSRRSCRRWSRDRCSGFHPWTASKNPFGDAARFHFAAAVRYHVSAGEAIAAAFECGPTERRFESAKSAVEVMAARKRLHGEGRNQTCRF